MKEIELSQGYFAIVDDEDYDKMSKYKWTYRKGYASRHIYLDSGKRAMISMHVQIFGKREEFQIDHINGKRSDNRKCNLRYVTVAQNQQNSKIRGGSSQYKGVNWSKGENKWMARIKTTIKRHHLGYFEDEIEAAIAYNTAAISFFGEYARINDIKITALG